MLGRIFQTLAVIGLVAVLPACGRGGCEGPTMNMSLLSSLRETTAPVTGPKAFLILPNPIDATSNPLASVSSSAVLSAGRTQMLPGLLSPTRLDNAFLKIRIKDITDALSTLATPNSNGNFAFQPTDVHYSETMAYRSVAAAQRYLEGLGFSINKQRSLYVMVQASGSTEANAYYDHGYLNPSAPRTIRVYGAGQYAPGMDQDIYWHEFGHLVNESISADRGIDYAGDTGSVFSEGGALHECLADYLAESMSDRPYIGKWIARNIAGYAAGEPLRSAQDSGGRLRFSDVAVADGTGGIPGRYGMGEWCSRVLWQVRQEFVGDRGEEDGAILSDRLIFSAVSLLTRDTSMSQFKNALLQADEKLHCGGYESAINNAFTARGFQAASSLSQTLKLTATPVKSTGDASGTPIAFKLSIQNTNAQLARNVRVRLESKDARLRVLTYQQAYGDMEAGQTINVGTPTGLTMDFSVLGQVDTSLKGVSLPYTLKVISENGTDTVFNGAVQL